MKRKRIAVLFGGCSSEYGVSLESAYAVITAMDHEKYEPVMIGITREGDWFHYQGHPEKIKEDTWCNREDCEKAVILPNRGEKSLMVFHGEVFEKLPIDAAFPVLHGKNGEDGTVQGMLELAGIPVVGCKTLASSLCMDKDRAHKLARSVSAEIPRSFVADCSTDSASVLQYAEELGFPLFVKPVRSGSSYGITKVFHPEELFPALKKALSHDNYVILEEEIKGFEVGCAVMGTFKLTVGEVDEVELEDGFFDFEEKYHLHTSRIHVPARIAPEIADRIKQTAKRIYTALGCSGFARVDLFLTPEGRIVFNEVNTIPGFTEHSRFPKMMQSAGVSFPQIISMAIELTEME